METRTFVLPAIVVCSLLVPLSAPAAPNGGAPAPVAVPVVVPVPVAAPASAAPPPPARQPAYVVTPKPAASPPAASPPTAATPSGSPPSGSASAPGVGAPAVPPATAASSRLPAAKTPIEAALQQVVMLERGGRPIGVGTLLNGDGRILTALSPLTHGNQISARYPEGQLVPVRLSYSDRAWDLALLTPEGDSRRAGLKASREPTPAAGAKLYALSYVREKQLGSAAVTIKAKSTLRGGDSAQLPDALELPFAPKATDIGAPLVNEKGEVVAIIARACAVTDKLGCTLAPYAAPVSAVRDFLRSVPMRRAPWVGIDVVAFDAGVARGVRVTSIAPEGPAVGSGLRAGPPGVGDVVLAVDGAPVASSEAFSDAVEKHGSAAPVRLTVLSEGQYREVILRTPPARNDRVFRSNPTGPAPLPQTPTPVTNPYR